MVDYGVQNYFILNYWSRLYIGASPDVQEKCKSEHLGDARFPFFVFVDHG